MGELEEKRKGDLSTEVRYTPMVATYSEDGHKELSAYAGCSLATDKDIMEASVKIIAAYPNEFSKKTSEELKVWANIFAEAVRYKNMAKHQLKRAVMDCITGTHKFGEFQIADVTGLDYKVRFYTYHETDCGTKLGFACCHFYQQKENSKWDRVDLGFIRYERNNEVAYVKEKDYNVARAMFMNGVRFI